MGHRTVEEGELGRACLPEEGRTASPVKGVDVGHQGCESCGEILGTPYKRSTSEGMDIGFDNPATLCNSMASYCLPEHLTHADPMLEGSHQTQHDAG